MKRFLIIFIVLQVFSNYTFAENLLKLPALFMHYAQHDDEDNFIDFLADHYANNHTDEHDHDHENLPFKHCHDCCAHFVSAPAVCLRAEAMTWSDTGITTELIFTEPGFFSSQFLNNIWQPPKAG